METIKRNLLKRLDVEKTELEQDLVMHVGKTEIEYGYKLGNILDILDRIAKVDNKIVLVHSYFKQPEQHNTPNEIVDEALTKKTNK